METKYVKTFTNNQKQIISTFVGHNGRGMKEHY